MLCPVCVMRPQGNGWKDHMVRGRVKKLSQ